MASSAAATRTSVWFARWCVTRRRCGHDTPKLVQASRADHDAGGARRIGASRFLAPRLSERCWYADRLFQCFGREAESPESGPDEAHSPEPGGFLGRNFRRESHLLFGNGDPGIRLVQ